MPKAEVTMSEEKMPQDVRDRLFPLLCDSKRGKRHHPEDKAFIEDCFEKYPEQYREMEPEVNKAAAPFGARQHYE